MHPEIAAALVAAHIADLRRARDPRLPGPRARPGPAARLLGRGDRRARRRVGWLLVELGLRMATPRAGRNAPPTRVTFG